MLGFRLPSLKPLRLLPLLLLGCSTVSSNTKKPTTDPFSELSSHMEKRKAVSGNLLVTTELGGQSVTAPGVLLVEWPDRVRLEVQDPVGGILALLVLQGEQFWLFDKDRPEILTGPISRLPRGLVPRLSGGDLVRVFLARPALDRLRGGKVSDGRSVVQDGRGKEILGWSEGEPKEWQLLPAGETAVAAFYDDYEFKGGLHYPTKIRLLGRGPDGKESQFLLVWKEWEPSVPLEKKLFQIPQQQTFGRKIKALP